MFFCVPSVLDPRKAYGLGSAPPITLKSVLQSLFPVQLNSSFSVYIHPPFLVTVACTHSPVFKNGDHCNPQTPIALTSSLSKALEWIVNEKIFKHLSDHNLLSDRQYGFRKY